MSKTELLFAIVDVETTGGNPKKDRITEIAIIIHNGHRVIEEFCTLVNPEASINPFISGLTGITDELVHNAPVWSDVALRVKSMTEGKVFVAHNVRFDYAFVRNEFKRLGHTFQRKLLCTERLSNRLVPNLRSYSLGVICDFMGIKIRNRHRAFGDAIATAQLFDKLLRKDKENIIKEVLKDEINLTTLPLQLSRKDIEELPEDTGIYYFKDSEGRVLYIGKSTHIKQRVISHFSFDIESEKHRALKKHLAKIEYVITGSELVALILESHEIKRWMPPFNQALRRKKYRYAAYKTIGVDGFNKLEIKLLQMDGDALKYFVNRRTALEWYEQFKEENKLNESLLVSEYNLKFEEAVNKLRFVHPHFFIIGEGRAPQEKSVVYVEKSQYIGHGYIREKKESYTLEELKQVIEPHHQHQDIHNIIRGFMKRKSKDQEIIFINDDNLN